MTNKTNRLAVLDEAAHLLHSTSAVMGENHMAIQYLQEARAAIAELIEAADVLLHYTQPQEMPAAFEKLAVALAGASGIAHCDAAIAHITGD